MSPLRAAMLVVLLEALAFGATFPVLSYYCQDLGGGPVWVGVMFALVSGPRVLTNPLFGQLSDRFGRRAMLIVSTVGTLTGSIGWALAPNIHWLALSRAVTGIFGAQAALAQAIAADVSPPERRAASVGLLGAAFGIALTLGPAIGGTVAHHVSAAAIGWVCAVMQLTSLGVIAFLLRETRPETAPRVAARALEPALADAPAYAHRVLVSDQALPEARGIWRPVVIELLVVTLVATLGLSQFTAAYPLLTDHVYRFTEQQTGYALACVGFIAALVQGGAVRVVVARFGERGPFIGGSLLAAAAYVLLAGSPPLWEFWTATVLLGIGMALATPCLNALLSRRVGPAEQGSIMGWNQGVTSLGRAGGALLAGWLYGRYGFRAPFGSAAGLLMLSILLFLPTRHGVRATSTAPALLGQSE